MADRHIRTRTGMRLGLSGLGDAMGDRLVVVMHPAPGAAGFDPEPAVTHRWGAHLLSIERPGYGSSDVVPEGAVHTIDAFSDAVAEYVQRAEREAASISCVRFGTVGVIGWGTVGFSAASLASRHPHLVDRLALIDTPSVASAPRATSPFQPADLGIDEGELALTSHPGVDRRIAAMLASAATQGDAGVEYDARALETLDEHPIDLGSIAAETILVYGADHPRVGVDPDGHDWARRIPHARVAAVTDSAGLAICTAWERILAHVAPRHGDVPAGDRDA